MHIASGERSTALGIKRARLRDNIATHRLLTAAMWLRLLTEKANFDPGQPRIPAGDPAGGQWVNAGGGSGSRQTRFAANDRTRKRPVDLKEEESRGGHTISNHVGRSPNNLLANVRGDEGEAGPYHYAKMRDGSFPSLEAATKLVNATLAQDPATVAAVADGSLGDAFIKAQFSSKTGIEAYRPSAYGSPYMRDTYGVGVYIVHDPNSKYGYTVVTAYPRND